jgi:hypothetical protein
VRSRAFERDEGTHAAQLLNSLRMRSGEFITESTSELLRDTQNDVLWMLEKMEYATDS